MPTMTKEKRIAVRLDAETKRQLEVVAAADQRSVSTMVARIVTDWLKQNSHRTSKGVRRG